MPDFRRSFCLLLAGLTLACAPVACVAEEAQPADEFDDLVETYTRAPIAEVKVVSDTWEGLKLKTRSKLEMLLSPEEIKEVQFGNAPPEFAQAEANRRGNKFKAGVKRYVNVLESETAKNPWLKPYALYYLGYCYFRRGEKGDEGAYAEARKAWEELLQQFPDTRFVYDVLGRIGETYYNEGKYKEAVRAYENAVKRLRELQGKVSGRPALSEFIERRACQAYYQQIRALEATGDASLAKSSYERLETQARKFKDLVGLARAGIGRALIEMKDYERAQKHFESMIKSGEPEALPGAYCGLADCYYEKGDFARARWHYLQVIILYPQEEYLAKAYYFAGRSYQQLAGKEANAAETARRYFKIVTEEHARSPLAREAAKQLGL